MKIMSTYILTSLFPNGFNNEVAHVLKREISKNDSFTYVASDFNDYEVTDFYFKLVVGLFSDIGINFKTINCVDDRTKTDVAQQKVATADVVWLAGGDTVKQIKSIEKYGLDKIIREHTGVVFGMSAGSINLSKFAVCCPEYDRPETVVYNGIGCVDVTVWPHFKPDDIDADAIEISKKHVIYGLQNEDIIVCKDDNVEFVGDIYKITNGVVEQI